MKLTIFIGSLSGGGAERVACNLSNYLIENGHSVDFLTIGNSSNAYNLSEKVNVVSLESKKRIKFTPLRVIYKLLSLKKYIKKSKTDCYLVMLPRITRTLFMFRKQIKVPIIVSERCSPDQYSSKTIKQMVKCFNKADGLVFQTEDAKNYYLERGVNGQNAVVIPNAINPAFIKEPYVGERRKAIVGVGRFSEQKNFEMLIKAFAKISPQFPEYSLELYGDGFKKSEYKALAEQLGVKDKLILPGFVSDIGERIKDASLFVLSSNYEGMPNALMEAMALGLPCVSTDCPAGGPKFLIENGVNGILVSVGSVEQTANAIVEMLSNLDKAKEMGKNASGVQQKLAPATIYAKWQEFIIQAVEDK